MMPFKTELNTEVQSLVKKAVSSFFKRNL